jgi:hypothetical protein
MTVSTAHIAAAAAFVLACSSVAALPQTGSEPHPLAKIDLPGSVPALLLTVTSEHGDGVLRGVRFVRRAQTQGGAAPAAGCDAEHVNATTASRYSAVYTFYR